MEQFEHRGAGASFKEKILIADDSPASLASLTNILSCGHYQTIKAADGEEALDKAFSELPDLILLDVMMPGINGFEAARKLKEDGRTKHIPIILVTALDDPEDKQAGREAGAEEYLTKPVRRLELLARVGSMIALKRYRDQLAIRDHSQRSLIVKGDDQENLVEVEEKLPLALLVEDNEADSRLIRHILEEFPLRLERVSKGKDAVQMAQSGETDLILLDLLLPDMSGFDVCQQVKNSDKGRDIPIIVITCLDDLDSKIKCIELRTDDYLVKPIIARELQARVKILLEKKRQLDKLRFHYKAAMDSAVIDWLTSLYNHGYFRKFLDLEIKKSLRQKYPISLIMVDIDDFKTYNDSYGHAVGNVLLQELGQLLFKSVRVVDLVARYGGDEFAIVLPYSDLQGALGTARRIDKAIRAHRFSGITADREPQMTVSMGAAWYPQDAVHVDELIHCADLRLYRAKRKGKNQIAASAT
jgi:two-component system cell cycle response regulator